MVYDNSDKLESLSPSHEGFSCSCCGACCLQLELLGDFYRSLDRGDGVCCYFDEKTNLCTIYDKRPLYCRVEEGYEHYFAFIPYCQYLEMTRQGCALLQSTAEAKRKRLMKLRDKYDQKVEVGNERSGA